MKKKTYSCLKTVYYTIVGGIPYLKFRYNMRGCSIGRNISVGRHSFFRGNKKSTIGSNIRFGNNCFIEVGGTIEDANLILGDHFSATGGLFISCNHSVIIGKNVLLGNNIRIYDSNHGMDPESEIPYERQLLECKPVNINDNTWIGDNCIILAGSTVGKHAIIGAGSVVAGVIPDYTVAAGNPAKVIKKWDKDKKIWVRI